MRGAAAPISRPIVRRIQDQEEERQLGGTVGTSKALLALPKFGF